MSGVKPPPPLRPDYGGVPITNEEARLLQEIVEEYCGLLHGISSTFLLQRRLSPRLAALGLATFSDYYHYLRYDPGGPRELEDAVERLTTHETYLFREQYQLDCFVGELLPEIVDVLIWAVVAAPFSRTAPPALPLSVLPLMVTVPVSTSIAG